MKLLILFSLSLFPLLALAEGPTREEVEKAHQFLTDKKMALFGLGLHQINGWKYEGEAWEERGPEIIADLEQTARGQVEDRYSEVKPDDAILLKLEAAQTLRLMQNQGVAVPLTDLEFHTLFLLYHEALVGRSHSTLRMRALIGTLNVYSPAFPELEKMLAEEYTGPWSHEAGSQEKLVAARIYFDRRMKAACLPHERWNSRVPEELARTYQAYAGSPGYEKHAQEAKTLLLGMVTDLLHDGNYTPGGAVNDVMLMLGQKHLLIPGRRELCRLVLDAEERFAAAAASK